MMRPSVLLLPILLAWPSLAWADLPQRIAEFRAEVQTLKERMDAKYEYGVAGATMHKALQEAGAVFSLQYSSSWGGWLYVDWSTARGFYSGAANQLDEWSRAIQTRGFDEPRVEGLLAAGMERFRVIDQQIDLWFLDDLKNAGERGYWLDRAQDAGCCGDLYYYYRSLADRAYDDSISPEPHWIAQIVAIPPVPAEGAELVDDRRGQLASIAGQVDAATQSGVAAERRAALSAAVLAASLFPEDQMAEAADVLRLLGERVRYSETPVDALLEQAQDMEPGPLRDAVLKQAEDALLDRIGHLAPLLASASEAGTEAEKAATVSQLLAEAQRLVMLRDDLDDPISRPSGLLRAVAGLKAAAGLLDIAERGDAKAKDLLAVVTDLGGSFKLPVAPTAPFAAPAGVVAAQLEQTRAAYDHASDAMNGVAEAIGGDPAGLQKALQSARALQETLNPRALVAKLTDGFVDGLASNLPFVRSIIGWFKD
jgi:hypothetical protein